MPANDSGRDTGRIVRLRALIRKETRQMLRDTSTLTLGILLPMILLVLFGYGLSLDVKDVPVAVVRDSSSPVTRDLFQKLQLSDYFSPSMVNSWEEGKELLRTGEVDAIVRRSLSESGGRGAGSVQIIVNGRDSNTARIMQRYLEGAMGLWSMGGQSGAAFLSDATISAAGSGSALPTVDIGSDDSIAAAPVLLTGSAIGLAVAESRIWYNNELDSHYFLIPGVTVMILTIIGSMLTSLVVAREWERGTWEAMAATPVRKEEIILSKTVPYYGLSLVGLALCLAAAAWVFRIPMRGSLWLIVAGSMIYLLVSLGIGLFISAFFRSQYLATQVVLVFSFMPTVMLSGFMFDLKSAPLIAYYIAHLFPSTWYVDMIMTLFLAGDVPQLVVRDMIVLALFALLAMGAARQCIRKSLE